MRTKPDANQGRIVQVLEEVGCSVQDLHEVGGGCPDILVGFHGVNYLVEIKTAEGKVNKKQVIWHAQWKGQPVHLIRSEGAALEMIGYI